MTQTDPACSNMSEQLRSTLIDAFAHELKTPLTSIKIATTALLCGDNLGEPEREFLTVIDEEADNLTRLANDAVDLLRVRAGKVALHREDSDVAKLASSAVAHSRRLAPDRELDLSLQPNLPVVNVDRRLIELALRQLLSNAIKYSTTSTPIGVSAKTQSNDVLIQVSNIGPAIPEAEQRMIFDRFHRAAGVRAQVEGAGLGLAIARDIIEAHGGRIWVTCGPTGLVQFSFMLPTPISNIRHIPATCTRRRLSA
jgi:two-component system, OmpR family, sensor histidine kinase KdpD